MKRTATALAAIVLAAGFTAPAHADPPEVNLQGSEASPCKPVQDELEDTQARLVELDRRATILSVRLRQARSKIDRQADTIERLRKRLRQQP